MNTTGTVGTGGGNPFIEDAIGLDVEVEGDIVQNNPNTDQNGNETARKG
jgi:hypothetical protein